MLLFGFELRQQRLDGLSTRDGIHETVLPRLRLPRVACARLDRCFATSLFWDLQPLDRLSLLQPPESVHPARPRAAVSTA